MTRRAAPPAPGKVIVDKGCPLCLALPDEACVTPDGKARNNHARREYVEVDADEAARLAAEERRDGR